jgi:hypothetical protein
MSSAPSVPGVEVGASWPGGCGQVLTAGARELPAAAHRMFGPAAVEMVDAASIQGVPAGRHLADALAGPGRCGLASTRMAALTH